MKYKCKECSQEFEWYVSMGKAVCECGSYDVEKKFEPCTTFVCKGDGFYGRSGSVSSPYTEKIQNGSLTDLDIQNIMQSDDDVAKNQLEKKANDTYKTKKELEKEFGKNTFDGVDNDGNLYKDISVAEIVKTS